MTDRPPPAPGRQRPSALAVIRHYVPIVSWLPAYDRADLRFDAIAGLVSWGVMVPVAMAYAGLAGVPPELGLVTAFAVVDGLRDLRDVAPPQGHRQLVGGDPVGVGRRRDRGVAGSRHVRDAHARRWRSSSGAILVVAGAARLGFLSQFLAASVVTGFVIGLAVTITVGQIPALLGTPGRGGTIVERLVAIAQEIDELVPATAALGIGSMIGIFVLKRVAPRIPGALVALVVGIVLSTALDLAAEGVAVVGEVATGIPFPSIPRIPIGDVVFLVTGAFGIVFLALAESIGAARSFGARHGYDIDPDQELIALGASNVASGLFGGFPVDASFSQSATGEASGNRTQLASLITAALVLATAIVLAPIFRNLPTVGPCRDRHRLGRRAWSTSPSSGATSPGSGPISCWP